MNPLTTTLRGAPVVVAPGKIFLVGEYAVLEGGAAVLAAVSRYAVAQYLGDFSPETPLIGETVRRAVEALGELGWALPPGSSLVNTSEFRHHQSKLGLGSSAAAAVAAAGAVFEHAGLAVETNRELLFTVADDGHRAAQGGLGSGADVAAAVHGGYVGFVRPPSARPVITRLEAPAGLHLIVFWTGSPSNTPEMIQAVQALATRSPASYARLMDKLRIVAERFVHAFQVKDTRGAVSEADAYGRLLERLGVEAGVSIMTPLVAEAADAARGLGGTAKPSGAGGGDIGIALFADESGAWEFARRCPAGISVLDVSVDLGGARRRTAHEVQTF